MRRGAVIAALALAAAPAPAAWPAQDPPAAPAPAAETIREIVVEGATAYDAARVQRILRIRPGSRLWRSADAHAQALEQRYHTAGYVAARVTGSFDAGTLRLVVDEGRLAEVVLEGLDPSVHASTRERLGLQPGTVLREGDIRAAVVRLEDASLGAFERAEWPNYDVERTDAGARLTLRFVQRRTRIALAPGGGAGPPWNPVDGLHPWLGLDVTRYDARSFRHTNAYGRGAYGFRSHDVRWAAGLRRPLGAGDRLTVGYEHHDLTDSDDLFRASMFEPAPATVLLLGDQGDFFRRRGDELYAFVSAAPRLQLGVAFRSDDHEPLVAPDDDTRRTPARAGLSRSMIGTVRFARPAPLFESARRQRESLLQRDLFGTRLERRNALRAEATFEWASREALGGDFTFRRLLVNVRGEHALSTIVRLRGRGLAGFTGGRVPPQRRLALGGPGTLRAREFAVASGRNVALLNLEAAFAGTRGRWPGVVLFYDGGAAWAGGATRDGWLSDVGVGLEWPAGSAFFVRVDVARTLGALAAEDKSRVTGRIRLPF